MRNVAAVKDDDCNACGIKCKEDYCGAVTQKKLEDSLTAANVQIAKYYQKKVANLRWDYGGCSRLEQKDCDKLTSYVPVLNRYLFALKRGGTPCLCPEQVQELIERVNKMTDNSVCNNPNYKNQRSDHSKVLDKVDGSSRCIPYETWERAMYLKMPDIKFNVEKQDKCLGFTYDIVVTAGRDKACELLYDISVEQQKACDLNYKVDVDKESCKIDYNILAEDTSCRIDFETYVELLECGLSHDLVVELNQCGVSPRYDDATDTIYFETLEGGVYNLAELKSLDKIRI